MATAGKDKLIDMIKTGASMTLKQQLRLTVALSTPAILAQLSMIVMEYIDSSMVGRLGANDSASIGLVATSMWLFGGLLSAAAMGFTVQVAHLLGATLAACCGNQWCAAWRSAWQWPWWDASSAPLYPTGLAATMPSATMRRAISSSWLCSCRFSR